MKLYRSLAEVAEDFPPPSAAYEGARNQFMMGATGVYVARTMPAQAHAAPLPPRQTPYYHERVKLDQEPLTGKPINYMCRGCGDNFTVLAPVTISPCCDTPKPVRR